MLDKVIFVYYICDVLFKTNFLFVIQIIAVLIQ